MGAHRHRGRSPPLLYRLYFDNYIRVILKVRKTNDILNKKLIMRRLVYRVWFFQK